ncbi:MAG: helix-turn-helix transcriptional regulator [Bacilli bacterium]|nr:helix-turn-helix transcriptional regulator [Bacilli bacterium]
MNYDKIGKFIQEKRKEKNLTQKELAEKIGVTDRAVSKWERGVGCPDVSILEILSKELDCSILEILKGRKIENEIIKVTEADDYVKDSMNISKQITKEKIISYINKVLVTTIIFIFLLLSYLNIVQIKYLNTEYKFTTEYYENKKIQESINTLEKNINIIKNNQGKYSDEDYQEIIKQLENMDKIIKSSKIYDYISNRKEITYTLNDLIKFNNLYELMSLHYEFTRTLEKYTDSGNMDTYRAFISNVEILSNYQTTNMELYETFVYKLNPFERESKFYHIENRYIRNIILRARKEISELAFLTELIIEVGEIHE